MSETSVRRSISIKSCAGIDIPWRQEQPKLWFARFLFSPKEVFQEEQ
jgi:hypothetical protein